MTRVLSPFLIWNASGRPAWTAPGKTFSDYPQLWFSSL